MEEKILIKSEQYNIKLICIVILCVITLILSISLKSSFIGWRFQNQYNAVMTEKQEYMEMYGYVSPSIQDDVDYYRGSMIKSYSILLGVSLGSALVVTALVYFWLANNSITVTDKRVYGKTAFGKRVDLPFDSVSAIGSSILKGIAVATSSGKISFLLIKNSDEIHKCVSELLIARQSKETPATTTTIKQEIPQSNADELKKYKELLDSGVISQDEFDAKKKQLLGL